MVIVQGAQCNVAKSVHDRPSDGRRPNPRFMKQLEHENILEHRPGKGSFLAEVCTLPAVGAMVMRSQSVSRGYAFSLVNTEPNN